MSNARTKIIFRIVSWFSWSTYKLLYVKGKRIKELPEQKRFYWAGRLYVIYGRDQERKSDFILISLWTSVLVVIFHKMKFVYFNGMFLQFCLNYTEGVNIIGRT